MNVGLSSTADLIEDLRARLEADRVGVQFGTRHGIVELVATRGEPFRVLVEGQEVPREEPD